MRHFLSIIIIAFATSALLGGFLSGRAAVPRFSVSTAPTPSALGTLGPQLLRETAQTDEVARDEFANDAAVELAPSGDDFTEDARIALVIVDAGRSTALESPFLMLNVPVTLVVNPSGAAAPAIYELAVQRGDAVYVQVQEPITVHALRMLRSAFPAMSGVATRLTQGARAGDLAALHAENLAFFDEYGADAGAQVRFASAGVRYAARGITVDDHAQRSYVAYMLRQAVRVARSRTAVVMARPFPGTLQAFEDLLARASRDGVHVVGLR